MNVASNNLRPEDRVLLHCARQCFDGSHVEAVADLCRSATLDWNYVFATCREQRIAPLMYVNLSRSQVPIPGIPEEVWAKFKQACLGSVLTKRHMSKVLGEVFALLNRRHVDVMLVKGAALSLMVYEQPWYTTLADVDLVLRPTRDEIAREDDQAVRQLLDELNGRRGQFREHIEYDYYAHHDVTMNGVLPIDSERVWQEAQLIDFHGRDVYVMTPEDTLIAAAVNSCRKRFFWLKSLLDIAEIIHRLPIDWSLLASKARDYGCSTIVFTALLVTDSTLGCRYPRTIIDELHIHPGRASVIRRLVSLLCQHGSIGSLAHRWRYSLLGRRPSLSLALTYATYPRLTVNRKLKEIWRAWRGITSDDRSFPKDSNRLA